MQGILLFYIKKIEPFLLLKVQNSGTSYNVQKL